MKRANLGFQLFPEAALRAEVARVLQTEIRRSIQTLSDRARPVSERVHETRKACKKVRAALALIRSTRLGLCTRESACVRDCGRDLSPLRDATVMVTTLDRLRRRFTGEIKARHMDAIRAVVRAHQRKTMSDTARVEEKLGAVALRLRAAATHLRRRDLGRMTAANLSTALVRSYRRARHFTGQKRLSDRQLHRWRKRTKMFGYHCTLLHFPWPPQTKERQHGLDAVVDLLGDLHDLAELGAFVRRKSRGSLPKPTAALQKLIRRRRREMYARARRLGDRSFAEKPSIVARDIARWMEQVRRRRPLAAVPLNRRGGRRAHRGDPSAEARF